MRSREMEVGKNITAGLTRPYAGGETDAARVVARVTAILSIAAGVIHISAAGDHTNLPVMMVGFLVVATLQVGLGALLLWRRPSGLLIAAAVAMMLVSVGIWVISRTRGIPYLPGGHMEPIGFKDGITVFFELAAVPGLLLLLSRDLSHVTLPSPRLGTQAMSIAAAGTFALIVPALALEGGAHHSHDEAVALGIHDHGEGDAHADEAANHDDADHPHSAGEEHAEASGGAHGHDQLASLGAPTHMHGVDDVAADDVTHTHSGEDRGAAQHQHGGDNGHGHGGDDGDQQTGGDHGGGHQHERGGGEQEDGGGDHQHGEDPHAGHDDGQPSSPSDDDVSLTYEPAEPAEPAQDGKPARGPALVWRSPNMPYEEGAHSGEFHHHGRGAECQPTQEQQAVADKLYAETNAELSRYTNRPDLALADGFYQVVGPADRFVHMISIQRVFDPTILDPKKIESFMYAMTDRGLVALGGMYIMPAEFKDGKVTPTEPKQGPQVAGCLTRWHKHEGWVAGVSTGGTNWEETPEMLHVWTYPGLDPWSNYTGPELAQLWAPWRDVPSFCRISYPGGTNVCFP